MSFRFSGYVSSGAIALLAALSTGCTKQDTSQQQAASAPSKSSPAAPRGTAGLPTLAQVALQPQPQLKTLEFAPIVQDFAPGEVVLKSKLMDVHVSRATYTAQGVEIDAEAEQHGRPTGGVVYLNYKDEGVLRDDRGNIYHLRDPKTQLQTRMARAGDRWKLRLLAAGYVPGEAKSMTLSLNINALDIDATLIEASWPVPPGVAAALRVQASDTIELGRGWRFAVPPAANSPAGNVSVRVYGVQWLQDGIAVDFEASNTTRDSHISLNSSVWSLHLVDDKNRRYSTVHSADLSTSGVRIPAQQRTMGRLLFTPQIAPDAKLLRLLTNNGPAGDDKWAPIAAKDDNGGAPRVGVDLGRIPQAAMSGLPAAAKIQDVHLKMAQQMPPTSALAASTIDPIAKLKQELGASDDAKGTKVELPGDVLFDFDKASLRSDAKPTLDKLADLLRRMDKPAQISGHTDSKGDAAYNQKLSQGRAAAVSAALVERGIDTGRLAASGYGKDRPKAPNTRPDGSDNPEGRQTNRRVEVLIATGPATKQ